MTILDRSCPEAAFRDSLSDQEFWDYVHNRIMPGDHDLGYAESEPLDWMVGTTSRWEPCPVCGQATACGFDAEGRALIHPIPEDTND